MRPSTNRAILWPTLRRIAGPILQEQMGGDRHVPQFFDHRLWSVKLIEGAKPILWTLTGDEWRTIAQRWFKEERLGLRSEIRA